MKSFFAVPLTLCCLAALSAQAETPLAANDAPANSIRDNRPHKRPGELSVMGYLPWYYGFGFGVTARYAIPIVHDGFIPTINNSVTIEPGLAIEYATYSGFSYTLITPYVVGAWNFYFSDQWRAYGGIGAGFHVGGDYGGSRVYIDPVVGGYYKLNPSLSLRGEVGYGGPKFGLSFAF